MSPLGTDGASLQPGSVLAGLSEQPEPVLYPLESVPVGALGTDGTAETVVVVVDGGVGVAPPDGSCAVTEVSPPWYEHAPERPPEWLHIPSAH